MNDQEARDFGISTEQARLGPVFKLAPSGRDLPAEAELTDVD
ncbi:hypothetical protein ACF1BU_38715 [Streptomyces sp. NPDC014724]